MAKSWIDYIPNHEQKMFSQGKQDGVIAFIFDNINPINDPPYYVEFGYMEDIGANTYNLRKNGWRGLLLDRNNHDPSINLHKEFLTSKNITDVFRKHNVPIEPDYISIDVDSTDLWLLKSTLKEYRPLLVSVEFNLNIPLSSALTFPDDPEEEWNDADCIFGASLKALNIVANSYNYTLVYAGDISCSHHHDAFFVRNDQLIGLQPPSLERWHRSHHEIHPRCAFSSDRYKIMLDYEEYELTNGDIEKSRAKAEPIGKEYLAYE